MEIFTIELYLFFLLNVLISLHECSIVPSHDEINKMPPSTLKRRQHDEIFNGDEAKGINFNFNPIEEQKNDEDEEMQNHTTKESVDIDFVIVDPVKYSEDRIKDDHLSLESFLQFETAENQNQTSQIIEDASLTDVTTVEGSFSTVNAWSSFRFLDDSGIICADEELNGLGDDEDELEQDNTNEIINDQLEATATVISETRSVVSDWDQIGGDDCFEGWPIDRVSMTWIESDFIPYLQDGKELTFTNQMAIIDLARIIFSNEATILDLKIEPGDCLTVVGDIHGQFEDLIRIFEQNGFPDTDSKFIFNGDIVDRGPKSIECLLTLLLMKICCPCGVFVTRGNHESHTCGDGAFKDECFERTEDPFKFFTECHDVFNVLPLGYTIQGKFFVCHGGLPEDFDLSTIRHASKPDYTFYEQGIARSLLWNDPHDGFGMRGSLRGGSTLSFGSDVTERFLARHGFTLLIRSHEYHKNGYFYSQNNKCLTVFSAPNYCNIGNRGTVIRIKSDLQYRIVPIEDGITSTVDFSFPDPHQSKQRCMTLNLEDAEFVFPASGDVDQLDEPSLHR